MSMQPPPPAPPTGPVPSQPLPPPYPPYYPPYYPYPQPKSDAGKVVIIVVVVIAIFVIVSVVMAAVLYFMVSGLIAGPEDGPRSMGISIERSADGTNWTLLIVTVPAGLTTANTRLAINTAGGGTALAAEAFATLDYATDGAVFIGDADTAVEVGERLSISATTYPTGFTVLISDPNGILFQGTLTG